MADGEIETLISTLQSTTSENDQQISLHRQNPLRDLATISEEKPTQIRNVIDSLYPFLRHDDPETRRYAAQTVCNVAAEHPTDGNEMLGALQQLFSDNNTKVRKNAVQAVEYISRECPHDVWDAVADILPLYADPNKNIRNGADWIFKNIIGSYPENIQAVVADLRPFLSNSETQITRKITYILADIAAEQPAAVRTTLPELQSLLSADDTKTRQHTTQALKPLSDEYPEEIQELTSDLRPLLSDRSESTRNNCMTILNNISVAYPILEQRASKLIRTAQKARSQNDYQTAEKYYNTAIDNLEKASSDAEPIDSTDHKEIQTKIEAAEKLLEGANEVHTQRESVHETLQTAERNFQEAIVRFAAEEKTVAKTRFRQARDGFNDAKQILTESEEQLLATPIEVSVEQQISFPSRVLADYHLLGETAIEGLSAANISEISDLKPEYKNVIPERVTAFRTNESISKKEITLLTILSWWDDDTHEFDSKKKISHRYNQADYGFTETQ